mmetsp:Transcript_22995/g.48057  ORF Transcript_22995/g.48057 Transcript_22995/m.48057 type:complete len:231 (-) Transcript_22995:1249-1941(-)
MLHARRSHRRSHARQSGTMDGDRVAQQHDHLRRHPIGRQAQRSIALLRPIIRWAIENNRIEGEQPSAHGGSGQRRQVLGAHVPPPPRETTRSDSEERRQDQHGIVQRQEETAREGPSPEGIGAGHGGQTRQDPYHHGVPVEGEAQVVLHGRAGNHPSRVLFRGEARGVVRIRSDESPPVAARRYGGRGAPKIVLRVRIALRQSRRGVPIRGQAVLGRSHRRHRRLSRETR